MDGPASVFNYDYQIVKLSEAELFFFAMPAQPGNEQREKFWLMCSWELRRQRASDSTVNSPHPR